MSVVLVATMFPIPEHRADVITILVEAIARIHDEPGIELYALHEGADRLVMVEKYESEQAREEHFRGRALADLVSALDGKLSGNPDVQILQPTSGRECPEGLAVTAPLTRSRAGHSSTRVG